MPIEPPEARIEEIVGESLSGVAFVHDYVEFCFDDKIVRSLTTPIVIVGSVRHCFPEIGTRDALCFLIGRIVEGIRVREDVDIEIAFSGGARVQIPLAYEERTGPEAAHYVPGINQPVVVW